MKTLPGRLGSLLARDVMTRDVIVVSPRAALSEAMRQLQEHHITGAPVVDDERRLVGIISLTDLTPRGPESHRQRTWPGGRDSVAWSLFEQVISNDSVDEGQTVGQRMSRDVASVRESASLVEVSRVMCDGHWHRVPVIDETGALTGIISTMDILAAVVNAADEQD